MFRKKTIYFLFLSLVLSGACESPSTKPLIIISKEYNKNFSSWLSMADTNHNRVNMYNVSEDSISLLLSLADGIIISGGPDIDPAIYGKESEKDRCENIDYRRDSLEMRMIRHAMDHDIPLLCICRGHQMLNAFMGGSLIIDIPTDHDTIIQHRQNGEHDISIIEGTLLADILKLKTGSVNSRHHQAVDELAPGFIASAYAPDGIIEAMELADRERHPFVLGLQWHPESMIRDSDSPLALPVVIRYMEAVHQSMH
jgi:putative glutamine amidotransferase